MIKINILILTLFFGSIIEPEYNLPIATLNRKSVNTLTLTEIGEYGVLRKERPGIPAHYHTGIDIKRPSKNFRDEPIFPICEGIVISIRRDGPYAQLIIEHKNENEQKFWTIYEHIAGIEVELYEHVNPSSPIARFMNLGELDRYGWQFNHFHFEVLKTQPLRLKIESTLPDRLFASNSLGCFTEDDLNKYFYSPIDFLEEQLK